MDSEPYSPKPTAPRIADDVVGDPIGWLVLGRDGLSLETAPVCRKCGSTAGLQPCAYTRTPTCRACGAVVAW